MRKCLSCYIKNLPRTKNRSGVGFIGIICGLTAIADVGYYHMKKTTSWTCAPGAISMASPGSVMSTNGLS